MLNRVGLIGPLTGMLVPVAGASDFKVVGLIEVDFDTVMGRD